MTSPTLRTAIAVVVLAALGPSAATAAPATTASGPAALALAAVIAPYSPLLSAYDKRAIARLFGGNADLKLSARKLSVTADSVVCRVSNVDITARSCDLTFDHGMHKLTGRAANELFATIAVAGVQAEGAAGSMIETMTKLQCTLDLAAIKDKGGGGADCTFQSDQ